MLLYEGRHAWLHTHKPTHPHTHKADVLLSQGGRWAEENRGVSQVIAVSVSAVKQWFREVWISCGLAHKVDGGSSGTASVTASVLPSALIRISDVWCAAFITPCFSIHQSVTPSLPPLPPPWEKAIICFLSVEGVESVEGNTSLQVVAGKHV